jgi:hypothetical protein
MFISKSNHRKIFKFGKKPARVAGNHPSWALRFSDYFDLSALPAPPLVFGKPSVVPNWGMLGNDNFGDCVEAGSAHETMYWEHYSNNPISQFTDTTVLSDYSQATGFNPNDPNSDNGTDMGQFAQYRQKIGILDANGNRHKINAYVGMQVGNVNELAFCAWAFGAVGLGVVFPSSAMDQFNAGKPFTLVRHSQIDGGHYMPIIGRMSNGYYIPVTWGTAYTPGIAPSWIQHYNDESICWLDLEWVNNLSQVAPSGVALSALIKDLGLVAKGPAG